jgi:hypothetical protein
MSLQLTPILFSVSISDIDMATREYRQDIRAQQTQANTDRIVQTAVALVKKTRRTADITLDDMSRDSGVTVRTILRRFGSRDGLLRRRSAKSRKSSKAIDAHAAGRHRRGGTDAGRAASGSETKIRAPSRAPAAAAPPCLGRARRSHREWLDIFGPQVSR